VSESIQPILEDCKNSVRSAQEKLYQMYYPYAMTVALPYLDGEEEAMEVVNDGFMKVFRNLDQYQPNQPFKGWFRRILINTAIDYFRKNKSRQHHLDTMDHATENWDDSIIDTISADEILEEVQKLSPAYRMVFNLYALEGYNHREIAEKLHISEGTSKSNLAKARTKLKSVLQSMNLS
tara:strand:- start:148 stop:684 length:537 start_codon:yes stop_codon:yes gene_type:complete